MTIKNRYPLPLISELLDRVKCTKYFTKIDVRDAFHRLRVALGHKYKTAFHMRYGHLEYFVMHFGLTGALGSFQAYINDIIRECLRENVEDDNDINEMDHKKWSCESVVTVKVASARDTITISTGQGHRDNTLTHVEVKDGIQQYKVQSPLLHPIGTNNRMDMCTTFD